MGVHLPVDTLRCVMQDVKSSWQLSRQAHDNCEQCASADSRHGWPASISPAKEEFCKVIEESPAGANGTIFPTPYSSECLHVRSR